MKTLMLYDHTTGSKVIVDEEDAISDGLIHAIAQMKNFINQMETKFSKADNCRPERIQHTAPKEVEPVTHSRDRAVTPSKSTSNESYPKDAPLSGPSFKTVREAAKYLFDCVEKNPGPILSRSGKLEIEKVIDASYEVLFPNGLACESFCAPSDLAWNKGSGISIEDLKDIGRDHPSIQRLRMFFVGAAAAVSTQSGSSKPKAQEAFRITSDYWRVWGDELCGSEQSVESCG